MKYFYFCYLMLFFVQLAVAENAASTFELIQSQLLSKLQQADFHYQKSHYKTALEYNDQAINWGQQLDVPEYVWRQFQQRAKILQALGKDEKAMAFQRLAIEQLQRVPYKSGENEQLLSEFNAARINYVKQLLNGPISQQSLGEVLDVWEGLKQEQITEFLGRSCIIPNQQIRQFLPQYSNTAVIYPIVYDDQLEILLVIAKKIYRFKIQQSFARIANLSKRLNHNIVRLRPEYKRYSKALYQILFAPILPTLKQFQIDTLVWIQDNALLNLPLAALQNQQGQFIVQNYALVTSPGLALLSDSIRKPIADKLFLIGEQQALSHNQQHFPALPAINSELNRLSHLFPNHLKKQGDFERSSLIQEIHSEEFDIIHIASHSQIGSKLQDSFLLTRGTPISFSDLADVITTRRFSSYPLELLTLSACQTATGDTESKLGLPGLLVNTGARSVLASLWKIDDQASAHLMQGFYHYWSRSTENKKSKALALQKVQKEMIDSNYRHPFYWSGFILIGHWD